MVEFVRFSFASSSSSTTTTINQIRRIVCKRKYALKTKINDANARDRIVVTRRLTNGPIMFLLLVK